MKSICFFNHFHNGDLFNSREFIKEIVESIDTKFYYGHYNSPFTLLDIDVESIDVPQIDNKCKFLDTDDIFYINTWVGSYFDTDFFKSDMISDNFCTFEFSYKMFSMIYSEINQRYSANLELTSMEDYFPSIDFSKFEIENIDEYVRSDVNKKVLFCNGPCMSGQCRYVGDLKPVIENLSIKYPNISFLATQKFDTNLENIKFTDDIIKLDRCDLNEIGYLSTFCDIIVGRNSGPQCFSANKKNINDPNKMFYAFGNDPRLCFYYEMDINCTFVFEVFRDLDTIQSSIEELILESNSN